MTRAETVAREIAERYPEMMPAWRASLTRQITAALVAFGREAEEVTDLSLARLKQLFDFASEERYQNLIEWGQLGARWKREGDDYGWNFHMGMAAGANWADILYQRVRREIVKMQEARALPPGAPDAHA